MVQCPVTRSSPHPCPPRRWFPSALCTHCQPHFSEVTSSTRSTTWPPVPDALGSRQLPLLLTTLPCPHLLSRRKMGTSGEGPGGGQEGSMPAGHPPVCPQLILASLSVAWQSGPVAPAVILWFLGHCHAGSAAKWGAGGAGGCKQGQGQGRRRAGSRAGSGVCVRTRVPGMPSSEAGGVSGGCVQSPCCLPRAAWCGRP